MISHVDEEASELVEKALQESLRSHDQPSKTFDRAEEEFVENVVNQSLEDEDFAESFVKNPMGIVNTFFTQTLRTTWNRNMASVEESATEKSDADSISSGWFTIRHVTLLHGDGGKVSTLSPDAKIYVDHVKEGKAYISEPQRGWVNQSSLNAKPSTESDSFFSRVMKKLSQSITKDEERTFRVIGEQGVIVRKDRELNSKIVEHLPLNTVITVAAIRGRRAFITSPVEGWCSVRSEKGALFLEQTNKTEIEQNRYYIETLRHKIRVAKQTNEFLEEIMGDAEVNDMLEHMHFSKTLIRNEVAEKRKELNADLNNLREEVEKRQRLIHSLFQKIESLRVTVDDS